MGKIDQMFTAYGLSEEEVHSMGFKLFLDLKLHDIPNTVAKAVHSLATAPIHMLTFMPVVALKCLSTPFDQGMHPTQVNPARRHRADLYE